MSFKTSKALHSALQEVLGSLTLRERHVLSHRFGLMLTLKETAALTPHVHDITKTVDKERLRQIEGKALRKCGHPSRADTLQPFIEITHGRAMFVLPEDQASHLKSLIRLSGDVLLMRAIFGEGPMDDDLRHALKARLVALLAALENDE